MSSKSGSETTETTLPSWLQDPVQRNLQRAEDLQRLPFMPYQGPEVAAFNPNQVSAFENNIDAAKAFGFKTPVDAMGGMPEASKYADGSFGYDSNSLYDQALLDSQAYDPAAFNKYQSFFDTSVGAKPNPVPNGIASLGGGGNNKIDPNMLAIQKLRDDRANATNTPTPMQNYLDDEQNYDSGYTPPTPTQNYMDDSQNYDSGYTPPTSMQNYLDNSQSYTAPVTPYSNSRLDSKGYTPTNVSKPIDQIMAEYLAKQAGK